MIAQLILGWALVTLPITAMCCVVSGDKNPIKPFLFVVGMELVLATVAYGIFFIGIVLKAW